SLSAEVQTKPRGTYTSARVQADVQRILELYRRQGYYTAQVDAKLIELDHNRVDLVFEIREGPETKVVAINFVGNKSFSDTELRGAITTTQSSILDFLKATSVYDPDRLNLDRELLRRFYVKNGFADMRVVSAIADTDPEKKGFFLTFTVDEGPRYTFGALDLEVTLRSLNTESLRSHVSGQPGDIYNAELIDKTVEALTVAAAAKGAPFAQVRPRVERDPARRTISVVYVIEQGPRIYIDRINIVGNTRTEDSVIRREFRVAEGDAYNKVMAEAGRQRLLKLGLFKSVKIGKEPGPAPDRVNLNVAVEEDSTGALSFAAGYSSSQGVIGEVSYTERNLMGTGQFLELKLSGSLSNDGSFNVSWTEPHFLDSNVSFGVDAFVRNTDYTASSGRIAAGYEDFRVGGSLRLGLALSDDLQIAPNYTLMMDNVYNTDSNASLAVKQIEGTAAVSSVGYSLIYDTRDNRKRPSRGFYFKGTQDFAGAGGDVNYIRTAASMRAYYPISQDITLAGRTMAGTIMGWGGQDVRVVDGFYKGGETIPGFAAAGLGPRDATTGDALGGTTLYSATADLRFPIPFVPQDLGLSGAVFTSAGALFGTDAQKFARAYAAQHGISNTLAVQDTSALRSSAGASLIWDSPVGALRVDFAGVLTKAPFDKTQVINFGYAGW
ncbi:MAG: outer membrane protein assembly factor BamA, partial [Rhodomicrobium sp.]|nr:outer membrane protein assembly factor BamA [Rhodomicrobium sp.]